MIYRTPLVWMFFSCFSAFATAERVNVVELFTSQGCYSCPPADVFLGELAEREDVITLACHVTYWNYLGWKDTFSQPFCDNRQRHYQSVLRGYKGVYTPQMVINGRYGGVGSQRRRIEGLLTADHRQQTPVSRIQLAVKQQKITVQLPAKTAQSPKKQQLFLLGTSGNHVLPIHSGENSGKQLPYFNPVEYVQNMGQWDGDAATLQWALPADARIKDWIVIAQEWPVGEIIAAGKVNVGVAGRLSEAAHISNASGLAVAK